jgi:deoxyadenosine/deoxycytidine kinase
MLKYWNSLKWLCLKVSLDRIDSSTVDEEQPITLGLINDMEVTKFAHPNPHIIELAGVAGAGKSTLLKAMMQRNSKIRPFPVPPKIFYLPYLLKISVKWLPLYIIKYRKDRWLTLQSIRNMGYLDTWLSFVRSKTRTEQNIFVLDPGSVHWLTYFQAFGPQITKHPRYQSWWKDKFEQWSSALAAIIWLDAPEELCLKRVLSRSEWHEIKDENVDDALGEVRCYRDHYEQLIPQMASNHSLKLFHFHTDQISTEQIVEQIFSDVEFWGKLEQSS